MSKLLSECTNKELHQQRVDLRILHWGEIKDELYHQRMSEIEKHIKRKPVEESYEQTAADDYLDYLDSRY